MRRDGKRVAADGKVVDKGFGIFPAGEFRCVCVYVWSGALKTARTENKSRFIFDYYFRSHVRESRNLPSIRWELKGNQNALSVVRAWNWSRGPTFFRTCSKRKHDGENPGDASC